MAVQDKLKNGNASKCNSAPTLKEVPLQEAIIKAINKVIENDGAFVGAFRENVIRVIGSYANKDLLPEYDEKIETAQKKILGLIENNAKNGAVSNDFDEEYRKAGRRNKRAENSEMERN